MNGVIINNDWNSKTLTIESQGQQYAYSYAGQEQYHSKKQAGDVVEIRFNKDGSIGYIKKLQNFQPQGQPMQQQGYPQPQAAPRPQIPQQGYQRQPMPYQQPRPMPQPTFGNSRDKYWEDKAEWDKENSERIKWQALLNTSVNIHQLTEEKYKDSTAACEAITKTAEFLNNFVEHHMSQLREEKQEQGDPQEEQVY
jgi:hypothetical protein